MRTVDFNLFNQRIEERRKEADRVLLMNKTEKTFRRKPRDEDEKKILDILTKKQWDKAVEKGKVRYISERVMYYDFD